uniref:Uncharacterized protein n=1 Tax=Cyprinus carpio carpio TaxID=630221 RepID=A0A8C1F1E1_CYPCA
MSCVGIEPLSSWEFLPYCELREGYSINCGLLIKVSLINSFELKLCNSSWQTGIKWLFYHRALYTNKIIFKVCMRLCNSPHTGNPF